jgi:WD40 repeat protein
MVTAAGDASVRVWTQTDGVAKQMPLEGSATVLAVSPDASQLASGGGSAPVLVRTTEGEIEGTRPSVFPGRVGSVRSMTFERDGSALFVVDDRGQVIRWRLNQTTASQLATLSGTPTALALSPDGRYLAVAGSSGVYVLLRQREAGVEAGAPANPTFSALEAKGLACSQADQPQLPVDAWKKYFGDEPLRYTCEVAAPASPSSPR